MRSMKKSRAGAVCICKWFAYNSMLYLRDKNKVRKCSDASFDETEVSYNSIYIFI